MYCSKQHVTCMRIGDESLCSKVLLNTKINFVVTVFQTRNLLSLTFLKYKARALKSKYANVLALPSALKYVCADFSSLNLQYFVGVFKE